MNILIHILMKFISGDCMEKDEQGIRPTWRQGKAYCGACGRRIPLKIKAKFCHKCGCPISWMETRPKSIFNNKAAE